MELGDSWTLIILWSRSLPKKPTNFIFLEIILLGIVAEIVWMLLSFIQSWKNNWALAGVLIPEMGSRHKRKIDLKQVFERTRSNCINEWKAQQHTTV